MSEPAERIKVLWLIKGLGPGGAERLLVEHAAGGDRDQFTYQAAYVLDWKEHLVPELETLGVRTHSLGVKSERDPRWVWRLLQLLRAERYDVVHVHSPLVAAVTRLKTRVLPRSWRPKLVYTEHNRWPSYNAVTRTANQLTYGIDDATLAVSDDVRDSVSNRYRDRVEVIVHGIDVERVRTALDHRAATRSELGVTDDQRLIITVANLRAGKNYPGLLDAAVIATQRDPSVQFVAAGQGQLETEIRALHAASGLGDRFQLLGYRDDATRLIAVADLFVLSSHHEGLPVSVMEALTLGVPVVAPGVGGLPEMVRTGENGILVLPESPSALADGIRGALVPELHTTLVTGARATGDAFSSRHAIARIEQCYRDLTACP